VVHSPGPTGHNKKSIYACPRKLGREQPEGTRRILSRDSGTGAYPLADRGFLLRRWPPQLMNYVDLSFPTPEQNLACDEVLLDGAEAGEGAEVLRVWEPRQCFVVVGYSNNVGAEVNVSACEDRQVAILRRCTGGGTVLQGPGCLNYTLVLPIAKGGPLRNVSTTNEFVMRRNQGAMEALLCRPVAVQGHTDLTQDGLKFSGNSQRRRRRFLLFHGTFLLNFDIPLVEALLRFPSRQPGYRRNRSHGEFLVNLLVSAASVKAALAKAWNAKTPFTHVPRNEIQRLACEKYSTRGWTWRF